MLAQTILLGDDVLVWLLLALGGALFVGNVVALARPPTTPRDSDDLSEAPRGRTIVMAAIGLTVAVAALAALLA